MITMNSFDFIDKLTAWRKARVQNYAAKKGLKYVEAIEVLYQLPTHKEAVMLLDANCDPEFHSSNQPTRNSLMVSGEQVNGQSVLIVEEIK